MQDLHVLTDDQAVWLTRVLDNRESAGLFEHLDIPEDIEDALVAKGLVRRFRNGDVEITLGGIREATRRPRFETVAEEPLEA